MSPLEAIGLGRSQLGECSDATRVGLLVFAGSDELDEQPSRDVAVELVHAGERRVGREIEQRSQRAAERLVDLMRQTVDGGALEPHVVERELEERQGTWLSIHLINEALREPRAHRQTYETRWPGDRLEHPFAAHHRQIHAVIIARLELVETATVWQHELTAAPDEVGAQCYERDAASGVGRQLVQAR